MTAIDACRTALCPPRAHPAPPPPAPSRPSVLEIAERAEAWCLPDLSLEAWLDRQERRA